MLMVRVGLCLLPCFPKSLMHASSRANCSKSVHAQVCFQMCLGLGCFLKRPQLEELLFRRYANRQVVSF